MFNFGFSGQKNVLYAQQTEITTITIKNARQTSYKKSEETGNDLGEALSLTAHLYDSTHKEVDFYNKDLNLSCEWSWFYYNVGYGESVNIREVFRTDSKGNKISINRCFLEHKKLNLNN